MKKSTHSLLLAIVASAMLLPAFASQPKLIGERQAAQSIVASSQPSVTAETSAHATTSAAPTQPTTTAAATSAAAPTAPSSSSPVTSAATHGTSAAAGTTAEAAVTSVIATTTDASGQVVTSYVVSTPTGPGPAPSNTGAASDDSGDNGLSTGSIIGLSVSGGIAVLGIILFFVWKFTRKRFSDFDDNEAIKWPELNAHNNDVHALPTNSTGRSGFGPENDSDLHLTRVPSPGGAYANSIAASSVPEMYGTGDPYAVPPLPHLNPNQPYHDEPGAYGQPAGYYDPYRGPVPNTFTDDGHGAEAIPMTQMARMRSPGPQVAYDMQGRGSPAPQVPYDMQGRGSPAPQVAMGYAGADERSRTPTAAVHTGSPSPSPHPGYGYGPR